MTHKKQSRLPWAQPPFIPHSKWKPGWAYGTASRDLAFLALVMGRQKIAAHNAGDPSLLRMITRVSIGSNEPWYGLVWISRTKPEHWPRPNAWLSGFAADEIPILVDWETLELVQ